MDGIKLLFKNNYSEFNGDIYKIKDGGGMGPRFMPNYCDIAMTKYDKMVWDINDKHDIGIIENGYGRYRDDCNLKIIANDLEDAQRKAELLVHRLNSSPGKIQFKIESVGRDSSFLDIHEIITNHKIKCNLFVKPTNTHSYLHRHSLHPNRTYKSVITGIAHRIRTIVDDEFLKQALFKECVYLMARGYDVNTINNIFNKYMHLSKDEVLDNTSKYRQKQRNNTNANDDSDNPQDKAPNTEDKLWIVVKYHPQMPDIKRIIKRHYHFLQRDPDLIKLFPLPVFNPSYKVYPNMRFTLHPNKQMHTDGERPRRVSSDEPGNHKCHGSGCKSCMETVDGIDSFTSHNYGTKYKIKKHFDCKSKWVVYCVQCKKCKQQYVGSTIQKAHERMNGHRNGICQNKGGCRTAAHFNDECKDDNNSNFSYYVIDCIDDVDVDGTEAEVKYLDTLLCRLERKWQAQLGTIWNGINGTHDWYNTSENRRNWSDDKDPVTANVSQY
eukprot:1010095_1